MVDVSPEIPKFITGRGNWFGAPPEKRRAEWRYLDNGKCDRRPLDKDYFNKYMANSVECPVCSKMVCFALNTSGNFNKSLMVMRRVSRGYASAILQAACTASMEAFPHTPQLEVV